MRSEVAGTGTRLVFVWFRLRVEVGNESVQHLLQRGRHALPHRRLLRRSDAALPYARPAVQVAQRSLVLARTRFAEWNNSTRSDEVLHGVVLTSSYICFFGKFNLIDTVSRCTRDKCPPTKVVGKTAARTGGCREAHPAHR